MQRRKVVVLAGGVGGARLARGFDRVSDVNLTVIVNIGDDAWMHGVFVSADLDTVLYTLAGIEGPHGWGRADDTFNVMNESERLGVDSRFMLGDRDLAFNLLRTTMIESDRTLTEFAARARKVLGIRASVLPASDKRVATQVLLNGEWIGFQEYFVERAHHDQIEDVRFVGADESLPAPGVLDALRGADLTIIAPSNPILSIWPILAIPGIKEALKPAVAVSPLIGTQTVKGPAAANLEALGLGTGHSAVVAAYEKVVPGLVKKLVVHRSDANWSHPQVKSLSTNTLIGDPVEATRLAREVLEWGV